MVRPSAPLRALLAASAGAAVLVGGARCPGGAAGGRGPAQGAVASDQPAEGGLALLQQRARPAEGTHEQADRVDARPRADTSSEQPGGQAAARPKAGQSPEQPARQAAGWIAGRSTGKFPSVDADALRSPPNGAVRIEEDAGLAALALQGGGFRAQAAHTGVVAGLLAAAGRQRGQARPTLSETGLLDRFGLISSVSGGSWFAAELAFSPQFLRLVEDVAAEPRTAAARLKRQWTDPWLKATKIEGWTFDLLRDVAKLAVRLLLGTGDEDTLFMLQFFLATGLTWTHFVDVLLESTGSIANNITLGSPVAAWAEGKVWSVNHAAVLGGPLRMGTVFRSGFAAAEYAAERDAGPLPAFAPARFSIELGAGVDATAPLPRVSPAVAARVQGLRYSGGALPIAAAWEATATGPLGDDLAFGRLSAAAGRLPLAGVVAASSAFLGIAVTLGPVAQSAMQLVGADLSPWVAAVPGGTRAFAAAAALVGGMRHGGGVSRWAIDALAGGAVQAAIDGGFTDGTGIAQAVAAGASEVVVILDSGATNDPTWVELMFPGAPAPPAASGKSPLLFPVFAAPGAAAVRAAFGEFRQLALPNGTRYLKVLAVGTLRATTAHNDYFGIRAGRRVVIHVVNVCSLLSIGLFEDFTNYNVMTQEVIATLLDAANSRFVRRVLLPMLLGRRASNATAAIVA